MKFHTITAEYPNYSLDFEKKKKKSSECKSLALFNRLNLAWGGWIRRLKTGSVYPSVFKVGAASFELKLCSFEVTLLNSWLAFFHEFDKQMLSSNP